MAGTGKSRRGFAAMSKQKQREIASKGGRASHRNRGRQSGNQSSESGLGGVQGFDDTDQGGSY